MPVPPLQLRSPSLGNVTQDISGGIANFAAGIAKQKEADRQAALDATLLKIKQAEVQSKGMQKQGNPVLREVRNPDGSTTFEWLYPPESVPPDTAAVSASPTPSYPGPVASQEQPQQPVAAPQQPVRRPGPIVSTGKAGPSPAQGYLSTPTPKEEDAAQWAPALAEGFTGVRQITTKNPAAAREGANFLNSLTISTDVPGFGNALTDALNAAAARGLSPDAQSYVQAFLRFAAARQFATGGKQLTMTEIRTAMRQYSPTINEGHQMTIQRLRSMGTDFSTTLRLSGRAYARIRALIKQTAPEYDLGDFDVMTQSFSGQGAPTPDVEPKGASPYGYTPR